MIAVFVGNQDRGKLAVMAVVPRQARGGFARGKPAVEQERGAATLDQRGITAAAAAEDSDRERAVPETRLLFPVHAPPALLSSCMSEATLVALGSGKRSDL